VLVPTLLALQFAIFGWRIAREISVGDQGRRTWLFLSDYLNFIAMLAVVATCVVLPIRDDEFSRLSEAVLAGAYVFVACTPLIIAGHYRLFSKQGRTIYAQQNRNVPWLTGQEAAISIVALGAAIFIACTVY
jgi:hypothetical protein